ncbi:MAG: hypothetical protein J7621_09305 [Niastella sp.]|nr:hypothetical protein [Niastella sp.]
MRLALLSLFTLVFTFQIQAQTLTLAGMQADFDSLQSALMEAHSGLYRYAEKPAIDQLFKNYRKRLEKPMSQQAFFTFLYQMLAELKDGHMRMDYGDAVTKDPALFPFRVWMEENKMIVLSNDTKTDTTIKPGTEILTINGQKVSTLQQLIMTSLPGDGFITTGKRIKSQRSFSYYYWLLVDQSGAFTITARNTSGKPFTIKLSGVTEKERLINRNSNPVNTAILPALAIFDGPKDNLFLDFIHHDSIAVLRIKSFMGDRFTEEVDSIFTLIGKKQPKAMILDMRGNGGGEDMYGACLVAQFQSKPFRYFDHIWIKKLVPSFAPWKNEVPEDTLMKMVTANPTGGYFVGPQLHPGVAEQAPARQPFDGKLVVVVNGGTMSTATDAAALLRSLNNPPFVGEESGGTYEGNTSGAAAELTLPYSKFKVKIHLYEYFNAVTPAPKGRGIRPGYPVPTRPGDILRGIDAPMQKAVNIALQ